MGCTIGKLQPTGDEQESIRDMFTNKHTIDSIRKELYDKSFTKIDSTKMIGVLMYFGASWGNIKRMVNRDTSPHSELTFTESHMPWKKTHASRYVLYKDNYGQEFRGCSCDAPVMYEVEKTQVDFGELLRNPPTVRSWECLPMWYGTPTNSLYMAYQKLAYVLIDTSLPPAPNCEEDSPIYLSDHFALRITKKPGDSDMAQPSPEGVHQDGSDIIMMTLVNRNNCRPDSGGSRIWSMSQPTGPYQPKDFASFKHRCLEDHVMTNPFETILAIDSRVRHEARPIHPIDPSLPCSRDVIVHWTRSPKKSGCDVIGDTSFAKNWISPKSKLSIRAPLKPNNRPNNKPDTRISRICCE